MLVTVTDKKLQHSSNNQTVDYYTADVASAQDYYPFGMTMPGRNYTATNQYRYGFNGKEKDADMDGNNYDYGFRIYNPQIGKFLSVDPLSKSYTWNSPYAFAENDVIRNIDLDGAEKLSYLSQYQYNNTWTDYLKWAPNAVGNAYNGLVVDTWNSGVSTVQSLSKGTYLKDLKNDAKQMASSVMRVAVNTYDYTVNTPVQQQFVDAGKGFIDPKNWEIGATLYLEAKVLPGGGNKGNMLKPTSAAPAIVESSVTANKIVAQGVNGAKFTGAQIATMLSPLEGDMITLYRGMTGT